MYAVIKLSGKFYAKEMSGYFKNYEIDWINGNLENGTPVIFVSEPEELEELGLDSSNIELV